MSIVTVKGISKSFSPRSHAVRDVSFSVPDKGFLSLLGPSGCGKSTILRLIAGLEEPGGGEILFDGERINDLPPAKRDIAMVFQSYALYPHMTCYENMAVSLKLRKFSKAEIERRIRETAELLGIGELLSRKPKQLSGGQRQRIALGRAIVRKPKVLLLDEPLSNLDAQLRERMRTELKRLFTDMGVTVIYVTHDQSEAMSMSDTIVLLKDGLLQQQGSPQEIYSAPSNIFVAGFMGSPRINLVRGELLTDRFISPDFELLLNGIKKERTAAAVLIGARPEHIECLSEPQPGTVEGRIEWLEPLGLFNRVVLRVGNETLSAVSSNGDFKPGSSVWLKFDTNRMLFFDAESGQKI
jgi:multiple sugar transport system ATP-binding protein